VKCDGGGSGGGVARTGQPRGVCGCGGSVRDKAEGWERQARWG
jgi:hypothetical protein